MNIFRPKYRMIREQLRAFGERIKNVRSEVRYTAAFWKERINIEYEHTWEHVITAYLAYWCTEEERKFIDCIFFKQYSVKKISVELYKSDTSCYLKQERIMDCILALAIQEGLIYLDYMSGNIMEEVAAICDEEISGLEWDRIKNVITKRIKRVTPSVRISVEAMLYVAAHNIPWRELPTRYGAWNTVYKRYARWKKSGLWSDILKTIGI